MSGDAQQTKLKVTLKSTDTSRFKIGSQPADQTASIVTPVPPPPPGAATTGRLEDPTKLRDATTGNLRTVDTSAPVDAATVSPGATQVAQATLKTETVRLKVMREKKTEASIPDAVSSTARLRPPAAATGTVPPPPPPPPAPATQGKATIKVEADTTVVPTIKRSAPPAAAAAGGAEEVRRTVRIKPITPAAGAPPKPSADTTSATVVLPSPIAAAGEAKPAGKPAASATIKLAPPPAAGGEGADATHAKRTLKLRSTVRQEEIPPPAAGATRPAGEEGAAAVAAVTAAAAEKPAAAEESSVLAMVASLVTVLSLGALVVILGLQILKHG